MIQKYTAAAPSTAIAASTSPSRPPAILLSPRPQRDKKPPPVTGLHHGDDFLRTQPFDAYAARPLHHSSCDTLWFELIILRTSPNVPEHNDRLNMTRPIKVFFLEAEGLHMLPAGGQLCETMPPINPRLIKQYFIFPNRHRKE